MLGTVAFGSFPGIPNDIRKRNIAIEVMDVALKLMQCLDFFSVFPSYVDSRFSEQHSPGHTAAEALERCFIQRSGANRPVIYELFSISPGNV